MLTLVLLPNRNNSKSSVSESDSQNHAANPDPNGSTTTGTNVANQKPSDTSSARVTVSPGNPLVSFEPLENERPVTEWGLQSGGVVEVESHDGVKHLARFSSQLPEGEFYIREVDLREVKSVKNDDLSKLVRLPRLVDLSLAKTTVSDAGLLRIEGLTKLSRLNLQDFPVGDAGMKFVARLTGLTTLILTKVAVTDAGIKELGGLKELQSLFISGDKITN